jgi:hypothetical protein
MRVRDSRNPFVDRGIIDGAMASKVLSYGEKWGVGGGVGLQTGKRYTWGETNVGSM